MLPGTTIKLYVADAIPLVVRPAFVMLAALLLTNIHANHLLLHTLGFDAALYRLTQLPDPQLSLGTACLVS